MSTGTVPETSFMSPVYGCALICRRQKQKLLRRDEQEKARRITGYLNEHQSKDKSPVKATTIGQPNPLIEDTKIVKIQCHIMTTE